MGFHISAAPSPHQSIFFVQGTAIPTEAHSGQTAENKYFVKFSTINISITPSTQSSGNVMEEWGDRS